MVIEQFHGSFSAEHGIGPHNLQYYQRHTPQGVQHLAARIAHTCDPLHIAQPPALGVSA